ncbi:DUF1127 domain-containing protein [Aminobacter aganoensis]|uniref:Uncharacterized protein YjiS (DUF1127 family) n=1 Tax=Aminobacter aganoensis TaxID=83264 RepID=A0A7X0FAT3_9HYPH|nr:DUF1127 domain-containing protein [Aminobacter aganoensis]MBB6356276.1 uncharacterized protein YjiS (DUF1127 family) [Aminobacter aganoensis]
MNDRSNLAPAPRQDTPSGAPEVPCRHLATLRGIVDTWRWRMDFRRELQQKSKDNPHLIDDIGLTRRQVEAEIAKRFWQA